MSELVAVLAPASASRQVKAFSSQYKLEVFSVKEEYGIGVSHDGKYSGCSVPLVSVNIHCSQPHLECVSHIHGRACGWTVSDALQNGRMEHAILITPSVQFLSETGETYPCGEPTDRVVCTRALKDALMRLATSRQPETIIIRFRFDELPFYPGANEIRSWPYLTTECARFVASNFGQFRTNSPSFERKESHGGMWIHSILFGVGPNDSFGPKEFPKRTLGELFAIPENILDGEYFLQCPFVEMGLDAAITVPLLYRYCNR
jgi:hypothetical protein